MVLLLVEHKRSNGLTLVGTGPSLSTNTDSGTANTKVVGSTRNGAEGRRHLIGVVMGGRITKEVDGGQPANGVPYIPSQSGQ